MNPGAFLDILGDQVLVCDGAMGTMLYARGVFINKSFDGLNLTQPELVADVHRAYLAAGADIIETNTFGANRIKLGSFGIADKVAAVNQAGVRIAREAAGERAYVAGAIGPLGIRIEPWGKTGVDEAREYFREQALALVEEGVDLVILETFRDLNEIGAAIAAVRGLADVPILAQMTIEEDGDTLDGTPPERFAPELERGGATVIGVNCSVGPAPMLETIERMAAVTNRRLSAQPNAGRPRDVEGRNIYLCSPEYMASYARRFVSRGVRVVGGCCGTTPEHIRQIKLAVGAPRRVPRSAPPGVAAGPASGNGAAQGRVAVPVSDGDGVVTAQKSRLAHALAHGHFVIAVELAPPRGHRPEEAVERARALKIGGVDVINIPDGPAGGARLSAFALAVLIEQRAGIETLLNYSCRDRNLLTIQSELLGAHAMGLRNVLVVTGEPQQGAGYPGGAAVPEVDSIGGTNVVARLNCGSDVGGQSIGAPTAFHIGVSMNLDAADLDRELRRFDFKVEAGAEFVLIRPTFDLRTFESALRRLEAVGLPLIGSVFVLESVRHAEFLANEVPGVRIPEEMLDRIKGAGGPEGVRAEGITIGREIALQLRGVVQGLHVSSAGGGPDQALAVIEGLR